MPQPKCLVAVCQSVARYPFDDSCIVVWVDATAHGHIQAAEVWAYVCRCLVAPCRYYNADSGGYITAVNVEFVVDVAITVNAHLYIAYAACERYSAKPVGRIYIAVVERGLYGCCAVVYRYEVGTFCHKVGGSVVECEIGCLQCP